MLVSSRKGLDLNYTPYSLACSAAKSVRSPKVLYEGFSIQFGNPETQHVFTLFHTSLQLSFNSPCDLCCCTRSCSYSRLSYPFICTRHLGRERAPLKNSADKSPSMRITSYGFKEPNQTIVTLVIMKRPWRPGNNVLKFTECEA